MAEGLSLRFRLLALAGTALFVGLIALYVREFPVLSNTLGVQRLVLGAIAAGLALGGGLWYRWRARFSPAQNHTPEILSTLILPALFMPLFASLLNRAGGPVAHESFEFISEVPYIASKYGVLRGETLRPTGYYLTVAERGRQYRLRYSQQAFYPITHQGETVLLPVRRGLLGFRVVQFQ